MVRVPTYRYTRRYFATPSPEVDFESLAKDVTFLKTLKIQRRIYTAAMAASLIIIIGASGGMIYYYYKTNEKSMPENSSTQVKEILEKAAVLHGFPGASIMIKIGDQQVCAMGMGYANVELNAKAHVDTIYRIASISKPITTTALGILLEQGKIKLDDGADQYLQMEPNLKYTIRQLASHTSGIRDYKGDEFTSSKRYENVTDALEMFIKDPLVNEPGTKYAYSTFNYTVLSAIMEKCSNENFIKLIERSVLKKIGMNNTVPDKPEQIIPERSNNYRRVNGKLINAPYADLSNKLAGGGYLSNCKDLVLFGQAYLRDQIVKPATKEVLWQKQTLNNGAEIAYGIGWVNAEEMVAGKKERIVYHTGGAVGASSILMLVPSHDLVLVCMVNLEKVSLYSTALEIVTHLLFSSKASSSLLNVK